MPQHGVFVGLGSNLDDPFAQLSRAIESLRLLAVDASLECSSFYRSRAVGPPQPDYVNAVVHFATELEPLDLLDALQSIEKQQGRVRALHWGPRTLDLDILLIDEIQMQHPRLLVPHAYLPQRNFVLVPLLELAPNLRLPNGDTVADLVQQVGRAGLDRLTLT